MMMKTIDEEAKNNEPQSSVSKIEHITDVIGDWGNWQRNIFLCYLSVAIFSAFHNLGMSLMAPKVNFWCKGIPARFRDNVTFQCYSDFDQKIPCTEWEFDTSFYTNTLQSEWNLVCSRSWLVSLTQSFYMSGMIASSLVCGHLSDKYGRLPVLQWSVGLEIFAGTLSALAPSIYVFMVARFLLAIGAYGRYLTGFMLVMETTGVKQRATNGIMCRLGWALGYFMLPGLVLVFRNFRHLALACTVPEVVWILWICRLPESPRWQLATNQSERACEELRKAARINGKLEGIDEKLAELTLNFQKQRDAETSAKKPHLGDLFKYPRLRANTLILCFAWFATGFVYYGLSLNIGDLGGNLVVNFAIAGLLEFPAFGLSVYALKHFGRRTVQSSIMLGAAIAAFLAIPFYLFTTSRILQITLGMVVKFFLSCSWNVIYIYSAEVYPTVVRQIGVGSNSAAARVGAVISPFMREITQMSHITVSLAIFGAVSAASGFSILLLPETRNCEIPDTIDEVEREPKPNDHSS